MQMLDSCIAVLLVQYYRTAGHNFEEENMKRNATSSDVSAKADRNLDRRKGRLLL